VKSREEHISKAAELWRSFNANERHGVQFGLFPAAKMPKDNEGYDSRQLSVALMDKAKS